MNMKYLLFSTFIIPFTLILPILLMWLTNFHLFITFYQDVGERAQLSFQDAGSPVMEEIIFFHDEVTFILVLIIASVMWLIGKTLINPQFYKFLVHGTTIEII